MLTKRLSGVFALALVLLLLLAPAAFAQSSDGSAEAFGGVLGLVCCGGIAIVGMAIGIYALYFLYTDAEARGQSGVMWLLIGLVAGWPLALIIWLVIRPEKKM